MPKDVRAAVLSTIERGYSLEGLEEDLVDCPACGTVGIASGTHDIDWDVDVERGDFGEPYIVGATPTVTFLPGHFECRACGLKLDGLDELRSAGIADSWEMEDINEDRLREELRHEWEAFEP
jgi:rubredoxin